MDNTFHWINHYSVGTVVRLLPVLLLTPLIVSLCNISTIAAMYQNINVETTEIVDVMQREQNKVLRGSIIILVATVNPL